MVVKNIKMRKGGYTIEEVDAMMKKHIQTSAEHLAKELRKARKKSAPYNFKLRKIQ